MKLFCFVFLRFCTWPSFHWQTLTQGKLRFDFFFQKLIQQFVNIATRRKRKNNCLSLSLSLILVIILFQQWDNARECEIKSFAKYHYDQSLSPKKYSSWRYKNLDNISLYAQTLLTLYSTHILSSVSQRSQTIYGSEKNFIWSIGIENDKKNYKFGRGRFMNFFTCDHG